MFSGVAFTFGPYRLDATAGRLSRDGQPLGLSPRYATVLLLLVSKAGAIVPKEALLDAGWQDVAVGDNSLEQAISSLRRTLGSAEDGGPYIETLARRGYRFRAPVTRIATRVEDAALDALLAPHRAFTDGRTALESFNREAVAGAQRVFEGIVASAPDYGSAHVGLANAYSLWFESTRADLVPDHDALAKALHHAREACRLIPGSGEAWATLGAVLAQFRLTSEAVAALRRAISLEDENWRHHLRFAYASWGDERLRAARHALKLFPGFAFGHWLAATVHIARGALDDAEQELEAGAAAQDHQRKDSRFGTSGLHFLLGLVRLARGDESAALKEFEHELALEGDSHIYTRQVCAHTRCALGAVHLRRGDPGAALAAFDRAMAGVHGYPLALAAAHAVRAAASAAPDADTRALTTRLAQLRTQGAGVEAATLDALGHALAGRHREAATLVHDALLAEPSGSAGWMIPVDPFLQVDAHADAWAPALTVLRDRAA